MEKIENSPQRIEINPSAKPKGKTQSNAPKKSIALRKTDGKRIIREEPLEVTPGRAVMVRQEIIPLIKKREQIAHIFYDAKLDDPEKIKADAKEMDWDQFTKVTSRLDTSREVKLDHNITAMGILGLLTGSDD